MNAWGSTREWGNDLNSMFHAGTIYSATWDSVTQILPTEWAVPNTQALWVPSEHVNLPLSKRSTERYMRRSYALTQGQPVVVPISIPVAGNFCLQALAWIKV